jgi:hypothetical protein
MRRIRHKRPASYPHFCHKWLAADRKGKADILALVHRAYGIRAQRDLWEKLRNVSTSEPKGDAASPSGRERRQALRDAWMASSRDVRQAQLLAAIEANLLKVHRQLQEFAAMQHGSPTQEYSIGAKHACLGTWNGPWLQTEAGVEALWQSGIAPAELHRQLAQVPAVRRFFDRFVCFFEALARKRNVQHFSIQLEASTRSEQPRVHMHVFWSYKGSEPIGEPMAWAYEGWVPHLEPVDAKGFRLSDAIWRGHYYCNVDKIGFLLRGGNCPKYTVYNVKGPWIKSLWAKRKITHDVMERECLAAGISCKSWLQDVEWQAERMQQQAMMAESEAILRKLASQAKPFRRLAAVEEWKKHFLAPGSPGGPALLPQRFIFLVLTGPSMYGKTSYARALWPEPFYLNVQGAVEPNLKDFRRGHHSHIIHDEACWRNVVKQKLIYQSTGAMVTLAKSPTNQAA